MGHDDRRSDRVGLEHGIGPGHDRIARSKFEPEHEPLLGTDVDERVVVLDLSMVMVPVIQGMVAGPK
jgi:hypothetical protein